ncbi:sodium-dependent transporter [Allomuricauda sp. SCSIO 65647]|uniref:sodium-dependent transporter n=1 Tax=Allomuricauda sp. SCSIO 65647 TaxID=2908843 RepID=UPI001F3504FC|nr:sodium-dependent transporter [Muricauda sp. SCSIO 65647]UJH68288.1 sodium-dependent transporter [Muricauda sp. SCSIO 65647]
MERSGFSSKVGFIAAAAGSAVGLGNIWKFPFEVGESGGAAFVIVYLAFCLILCFPLMVAEIAIGRKAQRNPVGAFVALGYGKWSIVGKLGILSCVLILSFYNVVAGWCFGYFVEILLGNFSIGEQFPVFVKDIIKVGSYSILFMATTAYIVSRGISGGIEKAAKILMPVLFTIILVLAGYAMTLPGASKATQFYLFPDFSKITGEVVYNALGHAFFSLSLGMGAMITYGSYVGKKDNIISSAVAITLLDVGIAFMAGLMLFPMVISQGLDAHGGAGLVFMSLPGVFGNMGPVMGLVVGILFFLLLSFAALTSTVSILEIPVSYLVDEKEMKRPRAVWLVAAGIFVLGIPSLLSNGYSGFFTKFITYFGASDPTDFMTFISDVASNSFLPLNGFLIALFVAFVWKKENLFEEVSNGNKRFANTLIANFLGFSIKYLCPWILGIVFVLNVLDTFFGLTLFG